MDSSYSRFLQGKLKDEHAMLHMVQEELTAQQLKNNQLLADFSALRKKENHLKTANSQLQEQVKGLQMELRKAKELRNTHVRQVRERRVRQIRERQPDSKQIFKEYIDNTFPRYKGMIKKFMKFVFIIEDSHQQREPAVRIQYLKSFAQGAIMRFLNWLFPKRAQTVQTKQLAQDLVETWKERQKKEGGTIKQTNMQLVKQQQYLTKMDDLEAKVATLNSNKLVLQGRIKYYERSLSMKGTEFVVHLKKMMMNPDNDEEMNEKIQANQKVQQAMLLFTDLSKIRDENTLKKETKEEKTEVKREELDRIVPLEQAKLKKTEDKDMTAKKAAPILKKNIFGYYNEPQLKGNYTLSHPTKHHNNTKHTQTLPEDLCILTTHPVIMVTLIDGNIKPQRNRHSTQFYVRIRINEEGSVDSNVREGLQPLWGQPFLLKDYDFPFLRVQLMHKSKGLRDYSIGDGKFTVSSQEDKIVNIRREKEFQGRVRFALQYPKGNIYEFKITSAKLQLPEKTTILKEQAILQFPCNPQIVVDFSMPHDLVAYLDRSVIILGSSEGKLVVNLAKAVRDQSVSLSEFTQKEGEQEVRVDLGDGWAVVIQGEVYLLICEQEEPEPISEETLESSQGKFFSVRAPPPITTVTYDSITLHSHVKFPLVFRLSDPNSISIVKELPNRQLSQSTIEPIVNNMGLLALNQAIKAPQKIYQFYLETLQGEQVLLMHESHLFERLLKQIHLRVSYKEEEVQQINYARKGKNKKQQSLYKEFAIETKELMLNHYRVFTKHFKRIGFVKFKLGYAIHDNLLNTEGVIIDEGGSQKLEPLREGQYFIQMQLSHAHLPSHSNGSSYQCKINGQLSQLVKGSRPEWHQGWVLELDFKEEFKIQVEYEVIEDSTFGNKVIYQGKIVIDSRFMSLGGIMVRLSDKDCLHLAGLRIPSELFRLSIDSIEGHIQEEADWVGEIDPYLTLHSQGRLLLKTNYLDNMGSHPVWSKLDTQLIVTRPEPTAETSIISCKLYDYDLVGRDDYLGHVDVTGGFNPKLTQEGQCEVMYGNLIKQSQICGTVRLKGSFEHVRQAVPSLPTSRQPSLNTKDSVYRVIIYDWRFERLEDFEGEKGWVRQVINECECSPFQIEFNKIQLENVKLVFWGLNDHTVTLSITRQTRHFFKTTIEKVGVLTIKVGSSSQFSMGIAEIRNESGEKVGECSWITENLHQVNYSTLSFLSSCHSTKVATDIGHRLDLNDLTEPCYIFYRQKMTFTQLIDGNVCELSQSWEKKDKLVLSLDNQSHAILGLSSKQAHKSRLEESSSRHKPAHDLRFKRVKHIHWQPHRYSPSAEFELTLSTTHSPTVHTLVQSSSNSQAYSQFIEVDQQQQRTTIFDAEDIPNFLKVTNKNDPREQTQLALSGDQVRRYVSGKGALYYQLEDYNSLSVLMLQHSFIFLEIHQGTENNPNCVLRLTCSLTDNSFEVQPFLPSCYLFQKIHLLIPNPSRSNTFFYEAQLIDSATRMTVKDFQVGFNLYYDHSQYRTAHTQLYTLHTRFTSTLVDRNYEVPPQTDHMITGMSFINIDSVSFDPNHPISRDTTIELWLNNHFQRIPLAATPNAQDHSNHKTEALFHVQKDSVMDISIIEKGLLTDSQIGKASLPLAQVNLRKEEVQVHCQVEHKGVIMGKLTIQYRNIQQMEFIDVNMFSFVGRNSDKGVHLRAQLYRFGQQGEKYQRNVLTSKGTVQRLQSQDSFIVVGDPREYRVTVVEDGNGKLVGQFKLYHALDNPGTSQAVLQPLRTSHDSLNALMMIEYEMKEASGLVFEEAANSKRYLIELTISNIVLRDHKSRQKDDISIQLTSKLRCNSHKAGPIGDLATQKSYLFYLYSDQPCQIALMEKDEQLGKVKLNHPYRHGEQRVLVIQDQYNYPFGLLSASVKLVRPQGLFQMRQISSIEATGLINTEYFAKMTPYIEMACGQEQWPVYVSELGLGRQKIYWRIGLLSTAQLSLTVKDKDMFFDDLIGNCRIECLEEKQQSNKTIELQLVGEQGEEQKQDGNGVLKILTVPVECQSASEEELSQTISELKAYMLCLGGLRFQKELQNVDGLHINLIRGDKKMEMMKRVFYEGVDKFMFKRDIQVEIDTILPEQQERPMVEVCFYHKSEYVSKQLISIGSSQTHNNSQDHFEINSLLPLARQGYTLSTIYFWLHEPLPTNVCLYLATNTHLTQMTIKKSSTQQSNLLVAQPEQLVSFIPDQSFNILAQFKHETLFKSTMTIPDISEPSATLKASIIHDSDIIGCYYAQIKQYRSEGEPETKKNMIGKSELQWIRLTVLEANLTKDLQFFSKMDPFCQFRLQKLGQQVPETNWNKTIVQDNVGLNPIWNESFFIALPHQFPQQTILNLCVMDSEVTIDRMVGKYELPVSQFGKAGEMRELEIHDKGGESAGHLVIIGRISTIYIVIRDIAGASQQVKTSIDGVQASIGRACPLDEQGKVRIKIGDEQRIYLVEELKAKQGSGLVWKDIAFRVDYDIYE